LNTSVRTCSVIWRVKITDPSDNFDSAWALRGMNSLAINNNAFEGIILPLSDGMLLARKNDE
jgi:predicted O-methyltransferase YrrM